MHHWLVVLRRIRTWHLLILLVLLIALSAFLLRQNNLGMVERRNLVKQADEQNAGLAEALNELQHYVLTHMNTDLGEGIFLEHSHQRAYDAAVHEAASKVNPNSQAYKDVEATCRAQYVRNGSFSGYISCVESGLKAMSPGSDPLANVKQPAVELFKYNFVSPAWSLDWAGLAVLATLLTAVLVILRVAAYLLLRLLLRVKHKN